ncbi:MAG: hypothetical protein K6E85_06825 [Lachnospiraceae bacterium]|nr:hypothetical protein [Lachnospiraceae bacterium]
MRKRNSIISLIIVAVLLILIYGSGVEAADQSAVLKGFIERTHLFYSTDILSLNEEFRRSRDIFENKYEDTCVVVTATVAYGAVSKNYKEVTLYYGTPKVIAKTSDRSILAIAKQLKTGDKFTVYGKIESIKKDSYAIDVERAVINSSKELAGSKYVYFEDDSISTLQYTDLTKDGHVVMNVPENWNNNYVQGRLTNNGLATNGLNGGYQFFLNALKPQNKDYAENFYIFYFDYQTYLDPNYEKYTSGDREDIEELIIKNIVGKPETKLSVDAENFEINGKKYDYCSNRYTVGDKTYRLEFVFVPDSNKGLICMLYLYYPREGAYSHLKEAAYLIGTLMN